MGVLHFQATEVITELGLDAGSNRVLLHLNTFHTRQALDEILAQAQQLGISRLLVITGDGSERLGKLAPASIGATGQSVTSVELLDYIHSQYPGKFITGVAFNPYEPQDHEMQKMRRKIDAGARFIITQPVIGSHPAVDQLAAFNLPVVVDVWMSRKLHLLSQCVGYTIPENTAYDPVDNLRQIQRNYPDHGLYLALLGFKTQLPILGELIGRAGTGPASGLDSPESKASLP